MDYEWDPRKAAENLARHHVDFADAVIALEDENALTIEDADVDDLRLKTLGMGPYLNVLYVVHTKRGENLFASSRPNPKANVKPGNTTKVSIIMTDDFSRGKRGPVIKPDANKLRITIRFDADIIEHFKQRVHATGGGNYQTLINDALREYIQAHDKELENTLRRIIREELKRAV